MTYFISGGAKNGKSTLTQDLAVALAGGGKHYYVATMISTGSEDDDRIRRHIADREGMGFEVVVCFWWTVSPPWFRILYFRWRITTKWICPQQTVALMNWWNLPT